MEPTLEQFRNAVTEIFVKEYMHGDADAAREYIVSDEAEDVIASTYLYAINELRKGKISAEAVLKNKVNDAVWCLQMLS